MQRSPGKKMGNTVLFTPPPPDRFTRNYRKGLLALIALMAALALTGCPHDGGGGFPVEVGGLTATPANGAVTLDWTDPGVNYTAVEITFSPAAGGVSQPITVAHGTNTAAISPLANGTLYTFTVKIVYAGGYTSPGTSATATPTGGSPTTITATDITIATTAPARGNTLTTTHGVTTFAGFTVGTFGWDTSATGSFATTGNAAPSTAYYSKYVLNAAATYQFIPGDGYDTLTNIPAGATVVAAQTTATTSALTIVVTWTATAAPAVPIDLTGKTSQNDIRDAITAGIANVTGSGTQLDPKVIPLANLDLSSGTNLENLYMGAADAFTGGEYLSLDLAGCTGASVSGINTTTLLNATCARFAAITLPSTVTSLTWTNNTGAFQGFTNLKSITMPGVTSLGDFVFLGCTGLASFTIPNNVTSLGDYAFAGCTGLTSITIPASVTSLGNSIFYYSTNLATLTFEGTTPPTVGTGAFTGTTALASGTVNVPNGTVAAYKAELIGKGVTGTTITDTANGGSTTDTL